MPAPTPLFIQDIATVKKRLRLSGVTDTSDGVSVIEEAVRASRSGFFRYLSASRIATLQAISHVDNPTDQNGNLRQLAEVVELKWIRMELLRTMPVLLYSSAPSVPQNWNDEGLLRGMAEDRLQEEIKSLKQDIFDAMEVLGAETSLPDSPGGIVAFTISPTGQQKFPGSSLL